MPGNHDRDREYFKYLPEQLKEYLTNEKDIKEWLTDEKGRKRLLEPFEAYEEFVKSYANGNLSAYACYHVLELDQKKIGLMGLNSALMARGDKDYGNLIIGEPQVAETLKKAKDADIRLAILHHPFESLSQADHTTISRLKKEAHFLLCGHQHTQVVSKQDGTDGNYVIFSAGTAYTNRIAADPTYTCSYNFVHLDFETGEGKAYLRNWNQVDTKWAAHNQDSHPNGIFSFSLPAALSPTKEKNPGPVTTISPSPAGEDYQLSNPVFNLPYRPKGEGMVGRAEALNKVRKQLLAGKPTVIGHTAAFEGLGGLGKTQLAVEYAYQFKVCYPNGVIWLTADQNMEVQLIALAKQAKWIAPESKHEDILTVALQRLKTFSDCLIIFDNVENREDIEPYLPVSSASPHLLVTSRTTQRDFISIPIELLDESQSIQLLLKEAGRRLEFVSEKEKTAATDITRYMDGLPLAIEIAGAYLQKITGCSFSEYYLMLSSNFNSAMRGDQLSSLTGHEQPLSKTLQISQSLLTKEPLLQDILDLLAWSGNTFMGISLMATILDKKEVDLLHPLDLGVSLRILHKASEGDRYDIHRLVRKVRQEEFPFTKEREAWVNGVCLRLGNWFEERRKEFTNLPFFEAELDHLKAWLQHITPYSAEHTARLTWLLAYPLFHWGKYRETHNKVLDAFNWLEQLPDVNPKLKANILNDLGNSNNYLGNFQEALNYHRQALAIRQKIFDKDHPDTAASLNNVGNTYVKLGYHQEALTYLQQALAIRQQLFGEHHPDTATSLNNIGNTYGSLGNHKKALKHKEEALTIWRQLFGENHPNTATSLNNIGNTYGSLGNHEKALNYHQQALAIWRQLFGENHPNTSTSLYNIGGTCMKQKKYSEALPLLKQAFDISSQMLGDHHPDTISSQFNYAFCQMKLKQFEDAYQQVKSFLKKLPDDHLEKRNFTALLKQIDQESIKAGFRSPSKSK